MYTVEKFYRRGEINRANLKAGSIYLPEELAVFTEGLRLKRVFIEVNWSIIARLYETTIGFSKWLRTLSRS